MKFALALALVGVFVAGSLACPTLVNTPDGSWPYGQNGEYQHKLLLAFDDSGCSPNSFNNFIIQVVPNSNSVMFVQQWNLGTDYGNGTYKLDSWADTPNWHGGIIYVGDVQPVFTLISHSGNYPTTTAAPTTTSAPVCTAAPPNCAPCGGCMCECEVNCCNSTQEECSIPAVDLVFVSDESGSIGQANFDITLQFMADIVNTLTVGSTDDDSHVGLVLFDANPQLRFYLNNFTNNADVNNEILGQSYNGGNTDIDGSVIFATDELFVEARGDRPAVQNVMIVITDGQDNDNGDMAAAYAYAQLKGITVFVVGIGSNVDDAELLALAGGNSDHVFTAADFDLLGPLIEEICVKV